MGEVEMARKLLSGEYYAQNTKYEYCLFFVYKDKYLILNPLNEGPPAGFVSSIPDLKDYVLEKWRGEKLEDCVERVKGKRAVFGTMMCYYFNDDKIYSKLTNYPKSEPSSGLGLDEFLGNIFDHLHSMAFEYSEEEKEFFQR
jgi:hypothetical protein